MNMPIAECNLAKYGSDLGEVRLIKFSRTANIFAEHWVDQSLLIQLNGMHYPEFLHQAKAALNVQSEDDVLAITRAFLHTLTAHLAGNAADNLGAQLPAPLLEIIREVSPQDRDQGERFKLTQFHQRVADKLGVEMATGERYTRQFMSVLKSMITDGELHKLKVTLSDDYAPLFEAAPVAN